MSVLNKILASFEEELEGETDSSSPLRHTAGAIPRAPTRQLLRANTGRSALAGTQRAEPQKPTGSFYQLASIPLSLELASYRNPLSEVNPTGDLSAAYRFRQLVDPIPALGAEYAPSGPSLEAVYGNVLEGASTAAESRFVNGILKTARLKFDASRYAEFIGHGEWRPVGAVPDDWYTDDAKRYRPIEVPLDGLNLSSTPDTALNMAPSPRMTFGRNEHVSLGRATRLERWQGSYLFVRFVRPWFDLTLLGTKGWWLDGLAPGYCSSGRTDANTGVLPIIATGMILARSSSFDGEWDSEDRKRIAAAHEQNRDVHIGPFRVAKPGAALSSVDVVAWRCEVVPLSPQSDGSGKPA